MLLPDFGFIGRGRLLLILGGALLMTAAASVAGGRPQLDEKTLMRLRAFSLQTARRLQIVRWLLDTWDQDRTLTRDEQAVMLTIAYHESGLSVQAASRPDAPDARVGGAFGMFQFTRPTFEGLGFRLEDFYARTSVRLTDAQLEPMVRTSARMCVAFLVRQKPAWTTAYGDGKRIPYLHAVRAMHPGDAYAQAREVFTAWQAGAGTRWRDVQRSAPDPSPNASGLGRLHFSVPKRLETLSVMRQALGLPVAHAV